MKTGNRLKKWKILAAGFVFMTTASAATAPVADRQPSFCDRGIPDTPDRRRIRKIYFKK